MPPCFAKTTTPFLSMDSMNAFLALGITCVTLPRVGGAFDLGASFLMIFGGSFLVTFLSKSTSNSSLISRLIVLGPDSNYKFFAVGSLN